MKIISRIKSGPGYYAIGEEFIYERKMLKVVPAVSTYSCTGCFFLSIGDSFLCSSFHCVSSLRKDETSVRFIRI